MNYTECTICGCMPKPDEWSGQIQGVCFDCGQYLVLSNYVFCYDWNYILVYLKEFAEDIRTWSDDDKQNQSARDYYYYSHTINLARP